MALLRSEVVKATSANANKTFRVTFITFSVTERKTIAYRYFFSMSDEERHSESEFYNPEEEELAKTEQNNMAKFALDLSIIKTKGS